MARYVDTLKILATYTIKRIVCVDMACHTCITVIAILFSYVYPSFHDIPVQSLRYVTFM